MDEEVVMVELLTRSWWSFLVRGIIAIALGIILIAWPAPTVKVFIIIFGLFVLIDGLVNVIRSIVLASRKERWGWTLVGGLLGFLIGAIILAHQEFALSFVVILVGIWAIIMGVSELAIAFDMPPESGRGLVGLLGVLSLIIGIIILVYPFGSVYALMVVLAIYAFFAGLYLIFLAFYALGAQRKLKKEAKAA